MPYIGNSPKNNVRDRFYYDATAGQTTFSGADKNGRTLAYQDGKYVDVYLNGVLLEFTTDYTAGTKTSVTLIEAAAADDLIEIIAYGIFSVSDTVSATRGGTFEGNVNVTADLTVDTDTLVVDSTNNRVGVGTTSPTRTFYVDGQIGASGRIHTADGSATDCALGIGDANTGLFSAGTNIIGFSTNGTERWQILANGNLKAATNGLGIDFSASEGSGATSSVLDDYEEGTFSPTFDGLSGVSYGDRTGRYTKIGRAVHFYIRVYTTNLNASSNDVIISGLPFAVGSSYAQPLSLVAAYRMGSNHATAWAFPAANESKVRIYAENMLTTDQGITTLTYSSFVVSQSNKNIVMVNGTYFTE